MIVRTEAEMERLGFDLAGRVGPGQLVTLSGPLGAGKTVLSRAILRALGFDGDVSSPTYAIIHEYDEPAMRMPVVHADLYRLKAPGELYELGLFDDQASLKLVEWPEMGGQALLRVDVAITITPLADGSREVTINEKGM
ncbi:tRNA (adenosine(37)-N6)-threonylcarbamoyltransferase complex ATPase subunit type 1 TsaE [Sphingorhabdus pulchriflava]|uniref:tRNA threonylcarbamoyladenosine biosynthesis protein TsaE n=1 Tax=Sphingorhabdus pulchriflava TaxID=2292257 RepID=A0A371BH92_9SPHN|nr:tRNA (adenosine(37)-N6)-threonylcarbamoyltransferase complex ATPase subunit type 1 TsaE [Sphingorhabdus pulchriflava]RDV06773.1 tRNA (adenosine(37)-N6)-threonylcarbamoyltransferase complex ATPase subunit type 1 TsaE [Sphingorhabdus pulchriflava]